MNPKGHPETIRDHKWKPALGLEYGCRHFANFLRRHDLVDAVSAYNAGEGGIGTNRDYIAKVTTYIQMFREHGLVGTPEVA